MANSKKFKCEQCEFVAKKNSLLLKHQVVHTTEKPFSCTFGTCTFRSKLQKYVDAHYKNVHEVDMELKTRYKCPWPGCDFRAQFQSTIRDHQVKHQEEKPFSCSFEGCNFQTKRSDTLEKHKQIHTESYESRHRIACSFPGCEFRASGNSALKSHQRQHTDEKPFACSYPNCSFRSNWKESVRGHEKTHQVDREKPLACNYEGCVYRTTTQYQLHHHQQVHSDERPFACQFPSCSFSAKFKSGLTAHERTHEQDEIKKRRYVCEVSGCGRRFIQSSARKLHYERVHSGVKFSCSFPGCSFTANTSIDVKRHEERHDPDYGSKFKCNLCPKTFGLSGHLKAHMVTHKEEKPFACTYPNCTHRANLRRNLKQHIQAIHEKVNAFPCRVAGCDYSTSLDHLRRQHEESHDPFRERSFKCPLCAKSFYRHAHLRMHVKRHVNERPHKCTHCDFAAITKKELLSHVKNRHQGPRPRRRARRTASSVESQESENKPWKCKYCDFAAATSSFLAIHISFKHVNEEVMN